MTEGAHITLEQALAQLKRSAPAQWATVFERGALEVDIFAPKGRDTQKPHRQDEIYIVLKGSGFFVNGDNRHAFGAGDFMFVPAGTVHRFEEFSEDTLIWAALFGPDGGEQAD